MKKKTGYSPKVKGLLTTIADGLTGYMTYQSRCGLSPAYTEYLLYDPIVRIAKDKEWIVRSEETVSGKGKRGDNKRIDFFLNATKYDQLFVGLEIKWIPKKRKVIDIENDVEKLRVFRKLYSNKGTYTFIIIAGVHTLNTKNKNPYKLPKIKGLEADRPFYQTVYRSTYTSYGVTVFKVT